MNFKKIYAPERYIKIKIDIKKRYIETKICGGQVKSSYFLPQCLQLLSLKISAENPM